MKELKPHLSKQSLEQPTKSVTALTHSSPKYVDPAVSFRQQTFDKGFFVKDGEENQTMKPEDGLLANDLQKKTSSEDLQKRSIAL